MAAIAAILMWPRTAPPPPHPLASIEAAQVVSATLDGVPLRPASPGFAAAAALPKAIASIRPALDVDWVGVHGLALALRDGTTLWLQIMPDEAGGWLRVTADARPAAAARTKAIHALRLYGYHVSAAAIAPIVARDGVGPAGVEAGLPKPTDLSTRTKKD